jgi:hypothetical protein
MAYAVIYEMRLGLKPGSILEKMSIVPRKLGETTTSATRQADKDSST